MLSRGSSKAAEWTSGGSDTRPGKNSNSTPIGSRPALASPSYRSSRQRIGTPDNPRLITLLMQNHIPGCSMLFNRALLELATPLPQAAHMHDWWVALCAAAMGHSRYLPTPLVRYRQHAGNQVGAQGMVARLVRPRYWRSWLRKMNRIYRVSFAQALDLRRRVGDGGTEVDRARRTIDDLLALTHRPRLLRPLRLWGMAARCQTPLLTGLFYVQSAVLRISVPSDDAAIDP